jgi:hypothetical protein
VARSKTATKRQAARPTAQDNGKAGKPTSVKSTRSAKPVPPIAPAKAAKPVKSAKPAAPPKSAPARAEVRLSAGPGRKKAAPTSKVAPKAPRTPAKRRTAETGVAGRTRSKRGRRTALKPVVPVVRLVKVKELDPVTKCGPGTSVEQLFRVDEELGGQATVHLVFYDKHGWYCVHGPRCAAVADVHSHTRSQQRARAVGR